MRTLVLFTAAAMLILASCSRKTHPVVTQTGTSPVRTEPVITHKDKETERIVIDTPVSAGMIPAPAMPTFDAPMIVIDESGKVITPREKLPPDLAARVDYKKITKGFSPEQRKNLIYRFKMVPPRVLFVPDNLASRSARGTYVLYKKKFWYWKKDDGLFHLDETYYQ